MAIPRTWIIPLASLIPITTCIVAFSLGPSPRKVLAELPDPPAPIAAEVERVLRKPQALEAITDELLRGTLKRPVSMIRLLVDEHYQAARPVLIQVSRDESRTAAVRASARSAAQELLPWVTAEDSLSVSKTHL